MSSISSVHHHHHHHAWQVIPDTHSSGHVRQHTRGREHWAHPGVISTHHHSGFPPILHLLPHCILPNFCPSLCFLGGEAFSQTRPSRLSVPGLMPGPFPPTPPHCRHLHPSSTCPHSCSLLPHGQVPWEVTALAAMERCRVHFFSRLKVCLAL